MACPALQSGRFFNFMLYFKKESVRNPVFGADKKAIGFHVVASETGIIALDEAKDGDTIKALNEHADGRRGGVVRISAEVYEGLKKNEALTPSPRRSSPLGQIRTSPSPLSFNEKVQPAVQPAEAAKGIRIMEEPGPPSSIAQFRQTGLRSRPINPPSPPGN